MAGGITESDVHTAADELAAKGERPTVERIRAHLGTGSPNTATRWLETWWNRLGTRLQRARPDLEGAPVVLAELAGQWWELALKHAQEAAHRELAEAEQSFAQAAELQHLVDQLRLLDVRLHEALEMAKSEREDWTEYVRSVENHALSEVDRAHLKELQVQLSSESQPAPARANEASYRTKRHFA